MAAAMSITGYNDTMAAINPFPGMNPYLEQRWGDVHGSLVTYARDMLQGQLSDDLRARMQERVYIELPGGEEERGFYPDVHVYQRRDMEGSVAVASPSVSTTLAEPLTIPLGSAEVTETYIEVIDARSEGRVVTIIEFLSRSNKTPGPGRTVYRQKQADARLAEVNLVEIDLLRSGRPTTMTPLRRVPPAHRTPYHASVWRAVRPLQVEYYPMPLRQRLATVRIPLRRKDADISLDLQALINQCYERGRYDDIDYTRPPDPPLLEGDARWTEGVVREKAV